MSLHTKLSLAGGVITPALYSRVDLAKWQTGAKTMRNMTVMRHGGALSRPGSKFVCRTAKGHNFQVRLIPFVFSNAQTYILEFGDLYMRVIKAGVLQTVNPQTISGITNANPAVLTYVGADSYANGDEVTISGVVGAMANNINGRTFIVAGLNAGANTFQLTDPDTGSNFNSTSIGAYASGGTVSKIFQITTPYGFALVPSLKFVQSGDTIFITDGSHAPQELARLTDTNWTIGSMVIGPSTGAPAGLTSGTPGAGTASVTALLATGEETVASSTVTYDPAAAAVIVFTWTAVAQAIGYNFYTVQNGVTVLTKGGIATNRYVEKPSNWTFNVGKFPPTGPTIFTPSNGFTGNDAPVCVGLWQQRLFLGNTLTDTQRAFGSFIGAYRNFQPVTIDQVDSYPLAFSLAGRRVQSLQHFLDLQDFLLFTSQGEFYLKGNIDGIITPTQINPQRISGNGISSSLAPLEVNGSALYVQERGGIVRDIQKDAVESTGYRGNDLSLFAAHLFISNTIVDWCYQQLPHSIVWCVMEDGSLTALTYVREQQIFAWHTHDTDGAYQQVASVPEGSEDVPYYVVDRTVNGLTRRYIEQNITRQIPKPWTRDNPAVTSTVGDIRDFNGLDCSLSYDGRNTTTDTMTLRGGTTWDYTETLTLTLSNAANPLAFVAGDVGNEIQLFDADGSEIRFTILAFTSAVIVTGRANRTVPTTLRAVAATKWVKADDVYSGLWHLEGREVAVFADGFVVANPNNPAYTTVTVTNGQITLARPYGVVHVGLPFICDFETLDINSGPEGESMIDKNKFVGKVVMQVEDTRGLFAGGKPPTDDTVDPLEKLYELKVRNLEGYDSAVALLTGKAEIKIDPTWNSNGRVFVRQVDPVPVSILSISVGGLFPAKPKGT